MKDLIKQIHDNAKEKGFYDKPVSVKTRLALINTELNEAIEADRIGKYCRYNRKVLEKADSKNNFINIFKNFYNNTVESELADAKIRILDLVGSLNAEDKFIKGYNEQVSEVGETEIAQTVCEYIFDITYYVCDAGTYANQNIHLLVYICAYICYDIEQLAKHLNIDLDWHIEMKMRYNETRERLHGKSY